ncbi:hypothetical protein I3842_09G181800 [Carya illinoinensis]|uniref:NB-ARC domain-containing protein n=1 Tax=Carya illinoinensis TaxID=32201 RepID=A0A922E8B5_CARIL|nr:hypothetical protein I3842_09G181800 [Carya illinoinensis]
MVEIAVSPLLQVVFDRLASPVLGKLQDLCDLRQNFEKLQDSASFREIDSHVTESKVYGRMEDKAKIIEPLSLEKTRDVSIIAIVGIGGLGKTTLAKLVYKDVDLMGCLDMKIWVHVSDDFDQFTNKDVLQCLLRESICWKRYLLVLDDVWNEDQIKWESFVNYLRNGVEGCKIIVTTRSENVASLVGTLPSYHLQGLPEDDCWAFLKEKAFHPGEEEDHNLKLIGKQIVKKCGGVPLAAMTLISLLRSSRDPVWMRAYDFKKKKSIHLWMAEGLILVDGHNPLEDIGNCYFDDLLMKSFFQEVKDNRDDSMKVYRMHDLIHELAQSVAGNEFLKLEHGPTCDLTKTRHSSVVCNFPSSVIPPALLKATRLRTLLLLSPRFSFEELPFWPTNFMYLRVLDISGSGIKRLQKSIGNLVSLRYLDLSKTSIQAIPDTICDLCNLQTLNLSGCCHLQTLPDGMEKLINLRHLNITGCERLTRMPTGIGKFVHLQTLSIYIVVKRNGEGISELSCLNLRGKLNIKCEENVRDAKETNMHILGLFWGKDYENRRMRLANHTAGSQHSIGSSHGHYSNVRLQEVEDILECLEPHEYLKKLFIKGYTGIKFPSWGLPSLTGLVLINLKRCKNLPIIRQIYLHH